MLTTLKATVEGDKLHWQDPPGDLLPANQTVQVLVTILNGKTDAVSVEAQISRRMAALQKLAALNALADIRNPAQWQRETREDRKLPGRES